ncbi:ATP-binding cassette domain-containing protein [Flagellimonas sp. CMM7]|uniref:ATP-binding cassette domain-containing protein n=1 Tax=Flagellimonas sp. CMM7 TaxID=2654676 RepID=UPI0013CFC27F|nr:ATP-binding cassette domain-containing protein [Flagellimonas sp. CMM7]UII78657.1 ATP-binding cassette domain-containing protein [Flagellimonas sp. CMM7]
MSQTKNYAILINNKSQTKSLVQDLLRSSGIEEFKELHNKKGSLFSRSEIERFMDEEERHDTKIITRGISQSLKSMSSGEQKKALLRHLLEQKPDFLVLINPFDNLDIATQTNLKEQLSSISKNTSLVQLVSRSNDILPITTDFFKLDRNKLFSYVSPKTFWKQHKPTSIQFIETIPPPIEPSEVEDVQLINFVDVSVSFHGRQVLNNINWTINKGEFWQLIGPNGSGKTTLLSMITGDSHKGYGQDLTLFGQKKGSGESVWDLKNKIGYFTPAMTDKFRGYHTTENMVISGFYDSVGLYTRPSDQEKRLAIQWLKLLQLYDKRDAQFLELTNGEKRLVMTARAMVKHPPLLILDEPTAGLDDISAALFIALINKISQESETTIIFVSHRTEVGLKPQFDYILTMNKNGSTGKVTNHANS